MYSFLVGSIEELTNVLLNWLHVAGFAVFRKSDSVGLLNSHMDKCQNAENVYSFYICGGTIRGDSKNKRFTTVLENRH